MKKIKNDPVVVMNFSGAYSLESFDKDQEIIRLDFRQLSGTDGYCSQEAAKAIKGEKLSLMDLKASTFLILVITIMYLSFGRT